MSFVYKDVDKLQKNTPLAGNGECVELIKKYVPGLQGRAASTWRGGEFVLEAGSRIQKGTAIATFDKHGRYLNLRSGNHAALVLRVLSSGIWVVDQWANDKTNRPMVGVRLIRVPPPRHGLNQDGSFKDPSNNALAFRVIE